MTKPTKLTPSQLKMKSLLKPIVEGILNEADAQISDVQYEINFLIDELQQLVKTLPRRTPTQLAVFRTTLKNLGHAYLKTRNSINAGKIK